jgi:hypothetical protein
MGKYGLSYEIKIPLTSKDYALWFEKYYDLLSSKEKANIKINPGWFSYKKKMGKKVGGIFLFKDKRFLGGNIFIYSVDKINVVYGVVEKLKNPNWSLGALVDYLSLKYAADRGYQKIGWGQDNNLYGFHLSAGLLQYKLNFGMLPGYKSSSAIYTTKFLRTNKFDKTVIFMGIKSGKNVFYILSDGSEEDLNLNTDLDVIRGRLTETKTPR